MGDPVGFNPSQQTYSGLPATAAGGPKIASHRQASTNEVASKTLPKKSTPILKNLTGRVYTVLKSSGTLLKKIDLPLGKIFPFKKDLSPEQKESRNLAGLKYLLGTFTETDVKTEGVFRLSGSSKAVAVNKKNIQRKIMPQTTLPTHVKASLVKSLLKEVEVFNSKERISLQDRTLPSIVQWNESKEENFEAKKIAITSLTEIVQSMPLEKREMLRNLIKVADQVSDNKEDTLMGKNNLALMFGPLLFPVEVDSMEAAAEQLKDQNALVSFILNLNQDEKQFIFGS